MNGALLSHRRDRLVSGVRHPDPGTQDGLRPTVAPASRSQRTEQRCGGGPKWSGTPRAAVSSPATTPTTRTTSRRLAVASPTTCTTATTAATTAPGRTPDDPRPPARDLGPRTPPGAFSLPPPPLSGRSDRLTW